MVAARGARLGVREAEEILRGPAASMPPLALAAGPDEFLRARCVRAYRDGAAAERAEFLRLEGDELEAERLAGALGSLTLFGATQRIWIREGAKLDAACESALLAWADAPAEGVRVLLTTNREREDLKWLGALAARGLSIACVATPGEEARWGEAIARERNLALPAGALEALRAAAPNLCALEQELSKLAVHADARGRLPASALEALRGTRLQVSLERWAEAVLVGDRRGARAERAGLAASGLGGTAALWAVAERTLGALEPGGFGFARGRRAPALTPREARSVLDALYRADRSLKRGELRETDLMDHLEHAISEERRG